MDPYWFGSLDPDPYLKPCEIRFCIIATNADPKTPFLRYAAEMSTS
jgi:hypothetical protein